MKYMRLFEIQVEHAAYPGGSADLRLRPRAGHASGERALARHRLLARLRPGAIEVLVPVGDGSPPQPLTRLPHGLQLGFELEAPGAAAAQLTDTAAWQGLAVPTYGNDGVKPALLLAEGATGPGDRPAPGCVARVEITGIDTQWLAAAPRFTVHLAARQMPWVYYALTRRAQATAPHIEDRHGKPALKFGVKRLTPRNAQLDARGRALLAQHPDHRCWRLLSRRPVPLQAGGHAPLALYAGPELLIAQLGAPPLQQSTVLALKPAQPSHCLYRVVRY
jgi:hypothetical protein